MKFAFKIKTRGITLVELLVTLGILTLIIFAIGSFQSNIFTYNTHVSDSIAAESETRATLAALVKQIREAAPAATGAFTFAEAGTSSVTFYSDTDNDGQTEQIRYFISAAALKKTIIKPAGSPPGYSGIGSTTEVLHNVINTVSNPVFLYYSSSYDGASTALASPVDLKSIRLVKLTFIVDSNPNRSPTPLTMTSQVEVRSLKDNL